MSTILTTATALKVTGLEEGGPVVRGTLDVTVAREALKEWAAEDVKSIYSDLCVPPAEIPAWAEAAEVSRVGLFRWNPCHPRNCYGSGDHIGHLGYVDAPGRGVWQGVLFR